MMPITKLLHFIMYSYIRTQGLKHLSHVHFLRYDRW